MDTSGFTVEADVALSVCWRESCVVVSAWETIIALSTAAVAETPSDCEESEACMTSEAAEALLSLLSAICARPGSLGTERDSNTRHSVRMG